MFSIFLQVSYLCSGIYNLKMYECSLQISMGPFLIPYEILLSRMKTSISVAAIALIYWQLIPYHAIVEFF